MMLLDVFFAASDMANTRTPLVIAINYQRLPIMRMLIEAGADINSPVASGNMARYPPLVLAMIQARIELVRLLIGAGANVNAVGSSTIGFCFYYPGRPTQQFIMEVLELWVQTGGTINVSEVIGHNQDWFDHLGGFGRACACTRGTREVQRGKDLRVEFAR